MTSLPTPPGFLHDAARGLALARMNRLRCGSSGRLARESSVLLAAYIHQDRDTAYPAFVFDLLVEAGLLGRSGKSAHPTEEAYRWLAQPAALQVHDLRRSWFRALDLTWRGLPDGRRGTSPSIHWQALVLTVLEELATRQSETTPEGLLTSLQREGLLMPRGDAQNLPVVRRAVAERVRRGLMFLLTIILPALALAEVEPGDGDIRVRVTPEGAAWLRKALTVSRFDSDVVSPHGLELAPPASALAFAPSSEPPLTVGDDGHVVIAPDAPAVCVFDVTLFARLLSPLPPARYELSRPAFYAALTRGGDAADILFRLTQYAGGSLPPAVADTLHAWQQETAGITWLPGYRLTAAHPAAFEALRQRRAFRDRTERLGPADAWVSRADAPPVFRYLRRLGYTVAPSSGGQKGERPTLAHPAALPLADMLVILRTYNELRRIIPGLAQLDLTALDKALTDALPPNDLAGVERLAASHAVLLARYANPPRDGAATPEREVVPPSLTADTSDAQHDLAELRERLQAAIDAGASLRLTYVDTHAQVTRRQIRPQRLETRWGREYVVAICELRQDERSFRLDRILAIERPSLRA